MYIIGSVCTSNSNSTRQRDQSVKLSSTISKNYTESISTEVCTCMLVEELEWSGNFNHTKRHGQLQRAESLIEQ